MRIPKSSYNSQYETWVERLVFKLGIVCIAAGALMLIVVGMYLFLGVFFSLTGRGG